MQRRPWLPGMLMLLGLIGCVGLWPYPLTLGGSATLPTGPDSFAHDGYLSIPAGLPFAGLVLLGLALLLLPRTRGGVD